MSIYCSMEDCSHFAFINGICYSHDKELKREAKEKLKVKKVYKIPAKSKKKAKEDREYLKRKAVFMVGKVCPIYPHLPVKDIHHKRGRTGDLMMDESNWLAVSRKGHMKIELNPTWAREQGYSLPRQ